MVIDLNQMDVDTTCPPLLNQVALYPFTQEETDKKRSSMVSCVCVPSNLDGLASLSLSNETFSDDFLKKHTFRRRVHSGLTYISGYSVNIIAPLQNSTKHEVTAHSDKILPIFTSLFFNNNSQKRVQYKIESGTLCSAYLGCMYLTIVYSDFRLSKMSILVNATSSLIAPHSASANLGICREFTHTPIRLSTL